MDRQIMQKTANDLFNKNLEPEAKVKKISLCSTELRSSSSQNSNETNLTKGQKNDASEK
jgi:hypothetical protein